VKPALDSIVHNYPKHHHHYHHHHKVILPNIITLAAVLDAVPLEDGDPAIGGLASHHDSITSPPHHLTNSPPRDLATPAPRCRRTTTPPPPP
jgi:hypothetical protein